MIPGIRSWSFAAVNAPFPTCVLAETEPELWKETDTWLGLLSPFCWNLGWLSSPGWAVFYLECQAPIKREGGEAGSPSVVYVGVEVVSGVRRTFV